ncbi:hypothetical protein SISSUDRAFT_1065728 [Sistotremastrum suecicum HHB10207 ss-3]|uniref:Integrase core domain-containing protein n=1 Tax=Sistotremastrum suecicum HHB10207 ss-3 TaxID=1314776 RepID=A0A165Z542_9AGAM|nr:hypothetical protein SISSUDRAFT_1065728 [Sistotremastrum suecicum HHB10207 ss-3]
MSHNPEGNNQHGGKIERTPELANAIQGYLNRNIKNYDHIRNLLSVEHNIDMSKRSLTRVIGDLQIQTARLRNHGLSVEEIVQCVREKLILDPTCGRGPAYIQESLKLEGIHIPINDIRAVMKMLEPEGFLIRHPDFHRRNVHTGKVVSIGPNETWALDGHEKLTAIGISIYGIRDRWGKVLKFQVVPNARNEYAVEYAYLRVVFESGGIPLTVSTDKGTETGGIYARQVSLRATFAPEIDANEIPPFIFIKSTRNISIERVWSTFLKKEGRNLQKMWNDGEKISGFIKGNRIHRALADWIWIPLAQASIDAFVESFNNHKVRRQPEKQGPSDAPYWYTHQFPEEFGGENVLIKGDMKLIEEIMENHPGREAMKFYPDWFAPLAEEAYAKIMKPKLTLKTAWRVFAQMLVPLDVLIRDLDFARIEQLAINREE